jgi:quinoprotein glucose dehydrogenase
VLGVNDLLPDGKRLVGNSGSAGPTGTANALVFVGATNDRRLRAFDAKTGKKTWAAMLEANANANPMSYQGRSGKQYVAVVAGNALVVYSL